ncbi:MAG TPA: hypothetical protein VF077_03765 [Nitrospiraceae bacterium]
MAKALPKAPVAKIPVSKIQINELVAQYRAVRDRIAELDAAHKRAMEPFKVTLSKLAGVMLHFLDATGQESAKTDAGTVYITTRHSASLADPESFMAYVMKHGAFELMDRKANSTACRDFAEENGELPPGVTINSIRTVGVLQP